jgi:hypothetical protein
MNELRNYHAYPLNARASVGSHGEEDRTPYRSPAWMRALRIGIGAISIVLSLVAIAYPGLAIETAVLVVFP